MPPSRLAPTDRNVRNGPSRALRESPARSICLRPRPLPFSPSEEERRQAVETLRAIIAADPLEIEAVTLSAEIELASLDLTSPPTLSTTGSGTVPSLADTENDLSGNGRRR